MHEFWAVSEQFKVANTKPILYNYWEIEKCRIAELAVSMVSWWLSTSSLSSYILTWHMVPVVRGNPEITCTCSLIIRYVVKSTTMLEMQPTCTAQHLTKLLHTISLMQLCSCLVEIWLIMVNIPSYCTLNFVYTAHYDYSCYFTPLAE